MKKIILSTFAVSCLFSNMLTMEESINKTLLKHPDIKSFSLKIKQSQKSYNTAYSETLPQLDFHGEYNPLQTFTLPANGSFNTIDDDGWGVGISVKQKVWDFSKTSSKVKASKIDEDISALSLEEVKVFMAYKVKSLYLLMVVQKEAIKVREKDLEVKKAYYNQAQALVKEGLKTDADASRFLSSVYIAKDDLAIAEASYEKPKTTLSLYIGEKIENDVELEYDIIKNEYNFNALVEKNILDSNYQVKIDNKTIEKNSLLHKSAKASHYGSIDAYASYNYLDTLNSYDSKIIGISINIPIYSGGKTTAEEQKTQISTQIAQTQKASKLLALKEEIATIIIDIKRYNKTIDAKKAQLNTANKTHKLLEARYKEGLTTYIEVLDAVSLVLNAELGLLQAYYSKSISINKLVYLKGEI